MVSKKYIGVVSTDRSGSVCEFELAEDFAELNEDEKHKVLLECLWDSGMMEVYYKEVLDELRGQKDD